MEYRIVEHDVPTGLELEVEDYIKRGWQPIGGVSYLGNMQKVVQAMVKPN